MANKASYHLVVVTSTVLPGAMEGYIQPTLERTSSKKAGRDFGLCYSPEFIALGSVIQNFLNPDLLLIGQSDPHAGDRLASIYEQICENRPILKRMNFVNAELTKIALKKNLIKL